MTLQEVKAATASLVFAEELADLDSVAEAGFFPALARAIWVTDGVRPTTRILCIPHVPPFEGAAEVDTRNVIYDLRSFDSALHAMTEPPALYIDGIPHSMTDRFVLSGGHRLYLPRDLTGDVRITYRIQPAIPREGDDEDTLLGLDEDLCQLLPLLIAHYLLLDDDAERAEHYLSLYREQYALFSHVPSVASPSAYRSVNNW